MKKYTTKQILKMYEETPEDLPFIKIHYHKPTRKGRTPKISEIYLLDKNDMIQDVGMHFTKEGYLYYKAWFKDGKRHGLEMHFCSKTGTIKQTCEYENGKRHGFRKYYNEDGTIRHQYFYHENKQQPFLITNNFS